MNRELYQQAKRIFHAIVELDPPSQRAALDEACVDQPELRRVIQELLEGQSRPTNALLDVPAVEAALREAVEFTGLLEEDEAIPSRIGRYRIIRRLGAGGMGVVYEAEQESPRRTVALKVIRPALASRALVRRFEREAEILGQLQHPGIAQVYEAGAAPVEIDGELRPPRAYLAMELIRGEPLNRFVRQHDLKTAEILDLAARLCDAVQHAHQKGVVHRDLKPANILVATEPRSHEATKLESGGDAFLRGFVASSLRASPKVLDFGVARLIGSEARLLTAATDVGQLLGTLSYMSPEQVTGDPALIDTRSDVYALGVILYELLAGRLPLEPGAHSMIEAALVIQQEEPPSLGALHPGLRGDVSNIVRKALEKRPEHRYQSAADLASDIRRFLNDEPILARAPNTFYVLRKFARRHRALVAACFAAGVVFLAGAVGVTWFALRAERARVEAEANRKVAVENAALAAENERRASVGEQAALREAYRANLAAVVLALDKHDVVAAEQSLQAAPVGMRHWEWEHLASRLDESLASVQIDEPDVTGACYDGSGSEIYVPTNSGRIIRLSAATLERLGDADASLLSCLLGWNCGPIYREDTSIRPWLTTQTDHLALCDPRTSELRRHDVRDWGMIGELNRGAIGPPVYSADGRSLVFCVCDDSLDQQTTWFIERDTGRSVRIPTDSEECRFHKLAISPDGGLVALALTKPTISIFETQSGRLVHELAGHSDRIEFMVFSDTGGELLSASRDGTIRRWNVASASAAATGWGHTDYVNVVAYSPDGTRVASASRDRTVRLWDAQTLRLITTYHGSGSDVISASFAPHGLTLLTASRDGRIHTWDAKAEGPPGVLAGHSSYVYPVAFSPDGSMIASGGWDRNVRLWDARTGRCRTVLSGPRLEVMSLAYSPDGTRLLASDAAHTLTEWEIAKPDTPARTLRGYRAFRGPIGYLWQLNLIPPPTMGKGGPDSIQAEHSEKWVREMLSGDERFTGAIVIATPTHAVALRFQTRDTLRHLASVTAYHRDTGSVLWERHDLTTHHAAADPTGSRVAVPAEGDVVRVLDTVSGAELAVLRGHASEVLALAWSPDATRIASAGRDKVIRLWDAERFEEVAQLLGHTSYVWSITFSPDGSTLASSGGDHTVRLWGTRPRRRVTSLSE